MAQYQSFPGVPGDSKTLEKLKGLRLPPLNGKRFLDVGCNEGFFCGFAHFEGARRSVGIDHSAGFIKRARNRFPECEFLQQGWDSLPEGEFDVILLASALHYAEDQPALIDTLVERLAPGGTLVLELGIVSSERAEWVKVERGIDERYFPTMPMLREVLAKHAWKWMGPSVQQSGDPVSRHVVHVHHRRAVAYLLMQPPGYGKSSIAATAFANSSVRLVSGDEVLRRIAVSELKVDASLKNLVTRDYSPYHLDVTLLRVFEAGQGAKLVEAWLKSAGDGDFALDAYVPEAWQSLVRELLERRNYLPVELKWERVSSPPRPSEDAESRAEAYFSELAKLQTQTATGLELGHGYVDSMDIRSNQIRLRGWALDSEGNVAERLIVHIGDTVTELEDFERIERPDVAKRVSGGDVRCGFEIKLPAWGSASDVWKSGLSVLAANAKAPVGWRLKLASNLRRSDDIRKIDRADAAPDGGQR
ncbi:class I SAM-dependent methyltransferase [Marilutibacter maris]|uniref:Methyltransferase type 11 n=1 Tax=Marilutibacter maris TaxID=1605891 RepID=A0A2U9T4B5_9GAMM|nr:class I SAM-dependent methyltransferase [Lysobacter maris]AWV06412.1 methyltransferase type 11 [Lysobacter maris]